MGEKNINNRWCLVGVLRMHIREWIAGNETTEYSLFKFRKMDSRQGE